MTCLDTILKRSKAVLLIVSLTFIEAKVGQAQSVQFSRDILPILSDNCFNCHGPDEGTRKAKLRLDTREGATAAKDGSAAIVPGKSDQSEALNRILSKDPDEVMPPPKANKHLTQAQIDLLRRWIDEGAQWGKHWAYETPQRTDLPAVKTQSWPKNSIDYFILNRLEREGLKPSPEASKETLIRRLTLDLTGVPPTLAEVDSFLADNSANAYERLVDRLLASHRYGERMAADWLDNARFADSNGYQNDFHRSMWPWRDWVIAAFNKNMPYDRFIIEQLAGDLLPNPTRDQKVATGFNRNNRTVTEAGSIEEEWRVENTVDRVETTTSVFLGLTMGCARCHDHKYDPISQKEFFQFYGFFNSVNEKGVYTETRGNVPPLIALPTPEQESKVQALQFAISSAEKELKAIEAHLPEKQKLWEKEQLGLASAPEPSGLVAHFSFDGSLKIGKGDSPLKYEGEGETNWVASLFGKALRLSGKADSFVNAGNTGRFDTTNAFSFGGWVNPKGSGAIVSRMDESAAFRGYDLIMSDDRRLSVHLVNKWDENAIKVTTTNRLSREVWSHVFVTYNGSSKASGVKLYIDGKPSGVEVSHDKLSGTIVTEQPFRIGRRTSSIPFDGAISDIRIYDRKLPENEVAALIHAQLRPVLAAKPDDRSAESNKELSQLYRSKFATEFREAESILAKRKKEKEDFEKQIPTVMIMEDLDKPRETYLLKRGQYDLPDKKELLEPDIPSVLPPLPKGAPKNRLGLALWMVAPENPLTVRVAMNHIWGQMFGIGLVKTVENFGVQGELPSHPELLDWLATEFIRTGWNLKAMQKLIVMSAAYRQSSAVTAELLEKDPENRLLARGPRFRLPAELIRDNALAVAGLLSEKFGGPSIKPYQPAGLWEELAGGANEGPYKADKGADLYRRSLYIFRKRTVPPPTMSTFDAPSREICQVKRSRTNTPLQALALLNDTTYLEASRHLAQDMIRNGVVPDERIAYGFRRATARKPTSEELGVLKAGLNRFLGEYRADKDAAQKFVSHGELPPDSKLDKAELAAYTAVASVILNLDETVTKE